MLAYTAGPENIRTTVRPILFIIGLQAPLDYVCAQ